MSRNADPPRAGLFEVGVADLQEKKKLSSDL
jgi:hypothetical protein